MTAPLMSLMSVKLAASIDPSASASLQRIEFDANATSVRMVRAAIRGVTGS